MFARQHSYCLLLINPHCWGDWWPLHNRQVLPFPVTPSQSTRSSKQSFVELSALDIPVHLLCAAAKVSSDRRLIPRYQISKHHHPKYPTNSFFNCILCIFHQHQWFKHTAIDFDKSLVWSPCHRETLILVARLFIGATKSLHLIWTRVGPKLEMSTSSPMEQRVDTGASMLKPSDANTVSNPSQNKNYKGFVAGVFSGYYTPLSLSKKHTG